MKSKVFGFLFVLAILVNGFLLHAPKTYAQSVQSTAFSASAVTQLLASGGVNPANSYNLSYVVLTGASSGGATAQLVTGGTNGNNCSGATILSANFTVPYPGATLNNEIILAANPVLVVPGSSALCIIVTGGTVNGQLVFNR